MDFLCLLVFSGILCGGVGAAIGGLRNHGWGFCLGFFLGPIGWLLAFLNDGRPKCPACASRFNPGARICPICRTSLVAQQFRSEFPIPRQLPQPPPAIASAWPAEVEEVAGEKPAGRLPAFVWKSLALAALFLSAAICFIVVVHYWPQPNPQIIKTVPAQTPTDNPPLSPAVPTVPTQPEPPAKTETASPTKTETTELPNPIVPSKLRGSSPTTTPQDFWPPESKPTESKPTTEPSLWRTWSDRHGHKIEAQWQGMAYGKVKLVTKDGRVLRIPLAQFCDEDQKWISERGQR